MKDARDLFKLKHEKNLDLLKAKNIEIEPE